MSWEVVILLKYDPRGSTMGYEPGDIIEILVGVVTLYRFVIEV